jgi:NADPH:quinone reductase-like Zn-dependent oxidoreductase
MKALVFDRFGDPAEVLQLRDLPVPEPGPGQVRVRMLAAPINPSDLLYVRGQYGKQARLPATAGFEGVGVVEAAGGGLLGRLRVGRRVAVLNSAGGNWKEQTIVPARQVVPVPAGVPDEQAATFFVNPASALAMVRKVLKVRPGNWLLQTAAGSALGRMVIRLARQDGFRTINVVRRREQADELIELGGDVVVSSEEESMEARVLAVTEGKGVPYALDAVGGKTGSAAARCLASHGRLLVYGTLSEEDIALHPRTLIAGQKRIEGFWLSEWSREQSPLAMVRLFRTIGKLMRAGVLTSDVAETFPLSDIQAAVQAASRPGRKGKVLLWIASK